MNNKKIMFIGAGEYQQKGIEKAKDMGLYVIATDGNPDAPGLKKADVSFVIDVKDKEKNLAKAKEYNIDAIASIASEVSVNTVAHIAKSLNLIGTDTEAVKTCTNKFLMRQKFQENNISTPEFSSANNLAEALSIAKNIGFPLVIKPSDASGSRGVKKISSLEEIKRAYVEAAGYSKNKSIVLEQYIEGSESSVEAFVYNGEIYIISLSDKVRTKPPHLLDTTVIFPSQYSDKVQKRIVDVARKMINSVGIDFGPVHIELLVNDDDIVPVEIAARGAGFKVFTDILPMTTGIDLISEYIKAVSGATPSFVPEFSKASILKFIEAKPGLLSEIQSLSEAKQLDGVYELELYKKQGDVVKEVTCGDDRIGHLIVLNDSIKEAKKSVENVEKKLVLDIEQLKA